MNQKIPNTLITGSEEEYGKLIWDRVLLSLKKFIKADQFAMWLEDTKFLELNDDIITISVKTNFIKEWIINNYFLAIKKELSKIDKKIRIFSIVVNQNDKDSIQLGKSQLSNIKRSSFSGNIFSALNPKFVFDNYITGDANIIAYKMSKDIASQDISYSHNNMFYIYSHVGMGKTHLLQSIANHINNSNPRYNVGYFSSEKFMHNFVSAIKSNTLFNFRDKINEVDTLLIDDIQFLCGKESTQKEFTLALNSLIELGKTIVIGSSLPPHALELTDNRTKSLLISSNIIHIESLDYALRLKILEHYNNKNNIKLDIRILNLIAEKITTNVRELEAALNNLTTYLTVSGKEFTSDNICIYIQNYMSSSEKKVTIENIIRAVSKFYRISKVDILSKKRTQKLVLARQIIVYLCKELTSNSLKFIGNNIGNRNHATVLYYLNKLNKLSEKNSELIKDINIIKNSIII